MSFSFLINLRTAAQPSARKKKKRMRCMMSFPSFETTSINNSGSGSARFHPTYFYQKELEVVVGALYLLDNNNSLEEQKQAFSKKNRVVVLSENTPNFVPHRCLIEEKKQKFSRKLDFFFFQRPFGLTGFREEEKYSIFPQNACFSSFRPT